MKLLTADSSYLTSLAFVVRMLLLRIGAREGRLEECGGMWEVRLLWGLDGGVRIEGLVCATEIQDQSF